MSDFRKKFALPTCFAPLKLNEKVLQSDVLDLGLGFPNYLPPKFVRDAMIEVARSTNIANYQYTRKVLQKENPGYRTADGIILDYEHLESIFNGKTKVIVLNTPHNPLGKVFTYEELTKIADLCKRWNVVCISDEVYEWFVYDSKKHIRMASLPGMWERTITIGSAGKSFGATGWNLGWIYGPNYLIENLRKVHLTSVCIVNIFHQEVVAICLEKELANFGRKDSYFASRPRELEVKRNFLIDTLTRAGLKPIVSSGGYYVVADLSHWLDTIDLKEKKEQFGHSAPVRWMEENVGVYGHPMAMFYSNQNKTLGEKFVRFCFVKSDDYLEKIDELFKKWNARTNAQ